jgi:hypothetical protein
VYVQRYIVMRSYNHFYHGNAIIRSPFLVVEAVVAISSVKVFSVFVEMHQWVLFALLWRYIIFSTAVHNKY